MSLNEQIRKCPAWFIPLGIFLLAVALRGIAVWASQGLSNDATIYLMNAERLAGGDYSSKLLLRVPLLFPFLVSLGVRAGLSAINAGFIINVLAGGLAAVGTYKLAGAFLTRRCAVVAGVFFCALPNLTRTAAENQTEALHIALVVWLAWAVASGVQKKCLGLMAFAGALTGGLAALRAEGILYVVPVMAAIVLSGFPRIHRRMLWKLGAFGVVAVLAGAALVPYASLNRQITGRFSIIPPVHYESSAVNTQTLLPESGATAENVLPRPTSPPTGVKKIVVVLWHVFKTSGIENLGRLIESLAAASLYFYLALFLVGLEMRIGAGAWSRVDTFLIGFWGWRMIVLLLFSPNDRYLYPILPVMLVWAAIPLAALGGVQFTRLRTAIVWGIAGLLVAVGIPKTAHLTDEEDIVRRQVAEFIIADARSRGCEAVGIASVIPQFYYYASRNEPTAFWLEIPGKPDPNVMTLAEAMERCRAKGAQYFVVERWNIDRNISDFTPAIAGSGLTCLALFDEKGRRDNPNDDIEVYRIDSLQSPAAMIK